MWDIIQRTIVPEDLTCSISVCTMPVEIKDDKKLENVENLISRIFGITKTDILSQKDYERSINVLGNYNFWEELYDITYGYFFDPFFRD